MEIIKEFWIIGLWGERNYHLIFEDGKLIMVGENGSGKSTVLRIVYYTLSKKWNKLAQEDFKKIRIILENEEKEFTKEQLGKPEEYTLEVDSKLISRLPIPIRRRCKEIIEEGGMPDDVLELISHVKFSNSSRYNKEIKKIKEELSLIVPDSVRDISNWIDRYLSQATLYMPTYRRIEKNPELKNETIYPNRYRTFHRHNSNIEKMEISHIGMNDVESAIQDLIEDIRIQYARSSAQLNLNCFKGILTQDFQNMQIIIPKEYREAENIEIIFESLNEDELSNEDKEQIKHRLIDIIEKTETNNEYDKIVIYYYDMLIKRYDNLKKTEDKLEHFFYVCNQYLTGKEFVYKPKSFEYTINVESRSGKIKEINIYQLSSGEKQIVALFSYIYLYVKKPCIMIIDEPELSLSVEWQERILEDIVECTKCDQLVVATQSPFVYDNTLISYAHAMDEFLTVE